jgi:DNA polymerase-4
VPTLCLDCAITTQAEDARRCPACRGGRLAAHPELLDLAIAHIDCDAFYASVEKRDRPDLAGRPVIVGGGERGVVTTACYIARIHGVRSAMPMFKALAACPDAVIIRPDFAKYTAAARKIRALMSELTPLVQPLSIDEAALDLHGTAALHGAPPAIILARLATRIEREVGVTVSIGLAPNRLLAKLAAGRDKPRGFSIIGSDARAWLAEKPVRLLPGIGPAQEKRLAARGITLLGQLQALTPKEALDRIGDEGPSLAARARGEDHRPVTIGAPAKSVSAETTFARDLSDRAAIEHHLWRLSEKLGARLRGGGQAASGVVLKLRTSRFAIRTRNQRLAAPTVLPEALFAAASAMLARETDGTFFRLVGIGANPLAPLDEADRDDLADPDRSRRARAQSAIDVLRLRFGDEAVVRGRALQARPGALPLDPAGGKRPQTRST